jgi:hypothetical protein
MKGQGSGRATTGVASGLCMIALGTLFFLDGQGVLDARDLIRSAIVAVTRNIFPLLLVVAGLLMLRGGRRRSKRAVSESTLPAASEPGARP